MYFLFGNHKNALYNQNQYFKNGKFSFILIDFISYILNLFRKISRIKREYKNKEVKIKHYYLK